MSNALIMVKTLLPGENQWMEITVQGEIIKKEDCIIVEYPESELTGMDKTMTKMVMRNDGISIIREGDFNSELHFKPLDSTIGLYQTPYGTLSIITDTTEYTLQERDGEYFLVLSYGMTIEGEYQGETAIEMLVQHKVQ